MSYRNTIWEYFVYLFFEIIKVNTNFFSSKNDTNLVWQHKRNAVDILLTI